MNAIQLATKFYDSRDTLRRLLENDKYESSIQPYRRALKQRMRNHNLNYVEAAKKLLEEAVSAVPDYHDRGIAAMYILAAAVDISEEGQTSEAKEARHE